MWVTYLLLEGGFEVGKPASGLEVANVDSEGPDGCWTEVVGCDVGEIGVGSG
jgi:hypothetical protein